MGQEERCGRTLYSYRGGFDIKLISATEIHISPAATLPPHYVVWVVARTDYFNWLAHIDKGKLLWQKGDSHATGSHLVAVVGLKEDGYFVVGNSPYKKRGQDTFSKYTSAGYTSTLTKSEFNALRGGGISLFASAYQDIFFAVEKAKRAAELVGFEDPQYDSVDKLLKESKNLLEKVRGF